MKKTLQDFCRSLEIESIGIAPPGPYLELKKILEERRAKDQYTEFEEECVRKRIDPSLIMDDVQSVIVCLFPYQVAKEAEGNVAKYTYALDYHILIKKKLEEIGLFLTTQIPEFAYQAFTDTGPLVDRYLAYLAGLGFYGLNNQIITNQYGSYVLIGYILTNYPFLADQPLAQNCLQCGRCLSACPGKALLGNFSMNPTRCSSYLTQKKGELTEDEVGIIRGNKLVFGCDICQDICPHNQGKSLTRLQDFQEDIMPNIQYEELLEISNKEFMRRYGKRAFSWRGRKILVRNFEYLL